MSLILEYAFVSTLAWKCTIGSNFILENKARKKHRDQLAEDLATLYLDIISAGSERPQGVGVLTCLCPCSRKISQAAVERTECEGKSRDRSLGKKQQPWSKHTWKLGSDIFPTIQGASPTISLLLQKCNWGWEPWCQLGPLKSILMSPGCVSPICLLQVIFISINRQRMGVGQRKRIQNICISKIGKAHFWEV